MQYWNLEDKFIIKFLLQLVLWEEGHTTEISEVGAEYLFNEFFGKWKAFVASKTFPPPLFFFFFQAKAVQQSGTEGQSLNTVCCATWFWSRAQACDWQHSLSQQGDLVRGDRATFLSLFLKLQKVWDWQPWKNKSPVLFAKKKDGRTIIIKSSPTVLCPVVSGLL